jgi:hypothetical protein
VQNFLWNVDIPIEIPGGRGVQTFVVDQPDYRSAVDQALAEAMCTEARAHRRGAALLIEQIAQITAVPWRPLDSLL